MSWKRSERRARNRCSPRAVLKTEGTAFLNTKYGPTETSKYSETSI